MLAWTLHRITGVAVLLSLFAHILDVWPALTRVPAEPPGRSDP